MIRSSSSIRINHKQTLAQRENDENVSGFVAGKLLVIFSSVFINPIICI